MDFNYFKKYYKMTVTDLSKQEVTDGDPKVKQKINFTENVAHNAVIFFISAEAKVVVSDFLQETVKLF